MFIEPEKSGDPYEVSDADTMLNYINPKAKKPDQVAILTREGCDYCAKAKVLLEDLGYDYAEVPLDHGIRTRVVGAVTARGTVPQVFINGKHIGGLEDLQQWAKKAA
jgi:glutaredoxin-like protein